MCFYIDNNNRKRLAKRDITCYKKLKNDLRPEYDYNYAFKYKLNTLFNDSKEIDILEITDGSFEDDIIINKGFHSYIKKPYIKKPYNLYNFYSTTTVKCIIPKGAYYYKNKTEYVSDKIKIIEILKTN